MVSWLAMWLKRKSPSGHRPRPKCLFLNNFFCIGYCPSFSKIGCINVRISENCEKEPSLYKIYCFYHTFYCCWKCLAKKLVTLQFINGEQCIECLGNSLQLDWLRFDTLLKLGYLNYSKWKINWLFIEVSIIWVLVNDSVVIVSKTFTTNETMLNSKTLRAWLIASLGQVGSSQTCWVKISPYYQSRLVVVC